jgi:hypothetical protein
MSAAKQIATETDAATPAAISREARAHLRAVFYDTVQALAALDSGDHCGADNALKAAMLAAADARAALQPLLAPLSPKAQVDASLKEWLT